MSLDCKIIAENNFQNILKNRTLTFFWKSEFLKLRTQVIFGRKSMSVYARFTYTVQRHLEGSILLKWVIWHVTFFFACRAQDYTFCLLIVRYMLSDKIKGKSALNLHERDKVNVCYWFRLSMHISTENSAGILKNPSLAKCLPIKSIRSAMVINMVTDIKQTCLRQGLGVTFTARKRPSKLMFTMMVLGHTLSGCQN